MSKDDTYEYIKIVDRLMLLEPYGMKLMWVKAQLHDFVVQLEEDE
jgi:hypothetical protein